MSTKGEKKQNKGFGPVHEAMKIFIHLSYSDVAFTFSSSFLAL